MPNAYRLILACVLMTHVITTSSLAYSTPENEPTRIVQQIDSLNTLSLEMKLSKPDHALTLSRMALALSDSVGYTKGTAQSHCQIGMALVEIEENEEAIYHLDRSLKLYQNMDAKHEVVLSYKGLGNANLRRNNKKALEFYHLALSLAEESGNQEEIPKITQNIALIFMDQGRFDEAIQYFKSALAEISDPWSHAMCLFNIGIVYTKIDSLDQALEYLKASRQKCGQNNDANCAIHPLRYMSHVYLLQNRYEEALSNALAVLELQEKIGRNTNHIMATNQIGLIYLEMKEFALAMEYFQESRILAEELEFVELPYIHANLSLAYEGMGDFELALTHLRIFENMKDSLSLAEKNTAIDELLSKFDSEKKEQEIIILQKENQLHQAELFKQTLMRNIAIIGAGLTLIFVFFIWYFMRQKIILGRQLTIKEREINRQKTLDILRANEMNQVKANIDGQEKERKRIAQELHDGIAGNLASIKMNLCQVNEKNDQNGMLDKAIDHLDRTYAEVRTISHHMMPPQIHHHSIVAVIDEYIKEVSELSNLKVALDIKCPEVLEVLEERVKSEVYRIIQELIQNVRKHASASSILILITNQDDLIQLKVKDNGRGFDLNEVTKGVGLESINSRVNLLSGEMNIESKPKEGATVTISIPIGKTVIPLG